MIDQILNRLKLLPDFYHQTSPVETGPIANGGNTMASAAAGMANH